MWSDDTLSIIPNLNTFKKSRGAPGGPNLTEMDTATIKVTRRVGSRLVGEMYDPTGAFTSPLTGCFKIFYSKLCMNTQGWDDEACRELHGLPPHHQGNPASAQTLAKMFPSRWLFLSEDNSTS